VSCIAVCKGISANREHVKYTKVKSIKSYVAQLMHSTPKYQTFQITNLMHNSFIL